MSLCIVCHERPACVPDRNAINPGRPVKRVCRECHAKRLMDDLEVILKLHDGEECWR